MFWIKTLQVSKHKAKNIKFMINKPFFQKNQIRWKEEAILLLCSSLLSFYSVAILNCALIMLLLMLHGGDYI